MNIRHRLFFVLVVAAVGSVSVARNTRAATESLPDILYTNVVVPEIPWSIQVVKISSGNHLYEIESSHAGGGALGLDTLSDQVAVVDPVRGEPVAAINGGFYLRDTDRTNAYAGCSRGLQIVDGRVLSAPDGNASLWIDFSGQPHAASVTSRFAITWPDGQETPYGLNGLRADDGVEIYTPAAGSSTHTTGGRELVLERPPGGRWLPLRMEREYAARVREIRTDGNTPLAPDTMVLSLAPAIMDRLPGVTNGTVVRISTRSNPVLLDAQTAISGGPVLVRNGEPQKIQAAPGDAYEFSSMLERHPRTAFGWNDRSWFLVQVDGRQKDLSLGMTLDELSDFLIKLGCSGAINLDGGGSSSLWFQGSIRNHPCDGYERKIANSLLVLLKKAKSGAEKARLANPESPERNGKNGE